MKEDWAGIFPALTTKFREDESIDFTGMENHINFQIDSGVHGLIVIGSLGENGTLSVSEKIDVVKTAVNVSNGRVPVLSCIAETTTRGACKFAEAAASKGLDGFMALPGMQYVADSREAMTHFRQIAGATDLPIMVYNNPIAYGVDVKPEMFAELSDEVNFVAIKESSDNVRRITDIQNLVGNRYQIFVGVDDLALESFLLGAVGWVAGLVNAFPKETVALYDLAMEGEYEQARALYRWFMPMLHLDVSTRLVQNIKLAETMAGVGTEHVRAPRLPLSGKERTNVENIVATALESRPDLSANWELQTGQAVKQS